MTIAKGQVFSYWTFLALTAIILASIYRAKSRKAPVVREIAGVKALDEAIGRATELGRPVHYTLGLGGLVGAEGPQTLAGLMILDRVAAMCAQYDVKLIVTICRPEVFPLASDIVKQAFIGQGRNDLFKQDTVRFLTNHQLGYAANIMGLLAREKVAANIMMGQFAGESLLLAESGNNSGAIQIAGTANAAQIPYFVAGCDYTLIGEELYVAAAVVSQDAAQLHAIRGQDLCRLTLWLLTLVGVATVQFGSKWITNLMGK